MIYRQLKNVASDMSCRQLNVEILVIDNQAVSVFEKRNCLSCRQLTVVDNDVFDCFSRVWELLSVSYRQVTKLRCQSVKPA